MSKPTFEAVECIRITVKDPDARHCKTDEERKARIVCRLHDYCMERRILPLTSSGTCWFHVADYEPEDAHAIKVWLKANGATREAR